VLVKTAAGNPSVGICKRLLTRILPSLEFERSYERLYIDYKVQRYMLTVELVDSRTHEHTNIRSVIGRRS